MLSTTKNGLSASHSLHACRECSAGDIRMACLRPSMGHETATTFIAHHGSQ
jgi:hypothetical protein